MPAYPAALERAVDVAPVARMTGLPGGDARLLRGHMPDTGVTVLLLQMDHLFAREGLYRDPQGRDYLDNLTRFASLAAAAARVARDIVLLKDCNWLAGDATEVLVMLRSMAKPEAATLHRNADGTARLQLHIAQYGIAPGQAAVCYVNDRMIGGGWIADTDSTVLPAAA